LSIGLRGLETRPQELAQALYDATQHLRDLVIRRSRECDEAHAPLLADEDAVRSHAMKI